MKKPMTIRLSGDARALLDYFSEQLAISRTAVIELAVRAYAKAQKVEISVGNKKDVRRNAKDR